MVDRVGKRLGNYRLIKLLGEGGFAEVYLGEHIHLGSQAAVKVLTAKLTDDEIAQFRNEARTIINLEHPHIVQVLDFGMERRIPFIIMRYAPNGSLRKLHPKGTSLPLPAIVTYTKQIAAALQYAHDQKLIHRDIKPDNMLLGRNNEVLLSDFGIAVEALSSRLLKTQEGSGTIYYMAPEQLMGKPVRASDQYSLGVVIYEWLTGTRPFNGTYWEVATQHLTTPPPSLREKISTIPPAIEEVVMTALAKDPKQRFDSVSAFANAIELASQSKQPEPQPQPEPVPLVPVSETTGTSQSQQSTGLAIPVIPFSQQMTTGDIPAHMSPQQAIAAEVSTNTSSPQTTSEISASIQAQPQNIPPWSSNEISAPATVPAPSPSPQQDGFPMVEGKSEAAQRGVSRRTVVLGLGLAGLVVAGGGIAWLVSSQSQHSSLEHGQTPTSTSSPSPLYTYRGHSGAVLTVAWLPDGTRIASGSQDGTVQVWDAADGSHVFTYRGHSFGVNAVAWSPDGTRIASGSQDSTVQVWDATDGSHVFTYRGHSTNVLAVAWSPDGTRIASGSGDTTVKVWDATDGSHVFTYRGHPYSVTTVAWSPDGKRIASAGSDATVQVWDATDDSHIFTYRGHSNDVDAVAWSPDGTRIASSSLDMTVQVWQAP